PSPLQANPTICSARLGEEKANCFRVRGSAARRCFVRVMGAAPPWGQSLLRSCLATHSFPPPPPLNGCACRAHPTFRADPSLTFTIPGTRDNFSHHIRVGAPV